MKRALLAGVLIGLLPILVAALPPLTFVMSGGTGLRAVANHGILIGTGTNVLTTATLISCATLGYDATTKTFVCNGTSTTSTSTTTSSTTTTT